MQVTFSRLNIYIDNLSLSLWAETPFVAIYDNGLFDVPDAYYYSRRMLRLLYFLWKLLLYTVNTVKTQQSFDWFTSGVRSGISDSVSFQSKDGVGRREVGLAGGDGGNAKTQPTAACQRHGDRSSDSKTKDVRGCSAVVLVNFTSGSGKHGASYHLFGRETVIFYRPPEWTGPGRSKIRPK